MSVPYAVRFQKYTVMDGCTTLMSECADGCVTLWLKVALGPPEVTALFVTLWVCVAFGPAVVPVATPPVGLAVL